MTTRPLLTYDRTQVTIRRAIGGGGGPALAHLSPHPGFDVARRSEGYAPTMFLWVSYPIEWLFFTLVRQTYRNPPPLPGLGTSYVETTRESLLVNTGGV